MAAAHNKHRLFPKIKFGLKLIAFSLVVMGASAVFGGGGKVAADTAGCPSTPDGFGTATDSNHNWGVPSAEAGPDGGNMAGLVIEAYDATTNRPVDLHYTLKSGVTSDSPQMVDGTSANGTHYTYDYNARIFDATTSSNGSTNFSNRRESYTSGTGQVGDAIRSSFIANGAGKAWICTGWDAFGPQNSGTDFAGNGRVLDCGPLDGSGAQHRYTQFWFTSLSNLPQSPGDDGVNGQNGYWSVEISNTTGGNIHINHWTGDQMGFNSGKASLPPGSKTWNNDPSRGPLEFNVVNGANTYVRFMWHPQKPPPTHGDSDGTGTCQNLHIDENAGSGNKTRIWVSVSGVTVGKIKYTDDAGNVSWFPGPTGNDHFNPRPQDIASWVGPGGDTGDTGEGTGGDNILSVSKEWWYQPNANSITVTYRIDHLPKTWDAAKSKYDYVNSSWNNGDTQYVTASGASTTTPTSIPCFAGDACQVPLSVDGDGPNNVVVAGDVIHVSGTYKNTGLLPLWYPTVLASDGNSYPVDTGGSPTLDPGASGPFSFTMSEPSGRVGYDNVSVTPQYFGVMGSGSCSKTVPVYQHFSSSVSASSQLKPNTEHPTQGDDYSTSITVSNDSSHDVNITTNSSFYNLTAAGANTTLNSNSGGTYHSSPSGYGNTAFSGHYNIPGGYKAGDEYCAHIHADYTSGFVGPDNSVVGARDPADDTDCPRIANEPYFKVLNSGVQTGGDFDQCTTNGGLLAGYNDISDPAGVDRGASSQLSNLALIKITGVASAQTPGKIDRSPTDLTFANTGTQVDASGAESPVLGGNFGGCAQLTNETAPSSANNIVAGTTSANIASGAYTHDGDLRITGGSFAKSKNVSIFVNGNVYITNDVKYNQTPGWTAGTVPSFVLHATGNIYIKNTVTNLAGVYIAQKDGSGNGGKIYTCADATGYAPMSRLQIYDNCNNQLVVDGSFVADQVNLMRTYGSLRDEEPNPAVGGTPGSPPKPQISLVWDSAGPIPGYNCVHIDEPSDSHTWNDNYLCEDPSYNVALAWTHYYNNPSPSGNPADGWDSLNDIKAKGYAYCTQWSVPSDPDTWYDNYLCANKNIGLTFSNSNLTSPTENCANISESADPDANWSHGGYWLCAQYSAGTPGSPGSPPTPKGPPYNSCSNQGAEVDSKSCAGEIFEFSPELYLNSSGGIINAPSNGALQYQALTSLPPVL